MPKDGELSHGCACRLHHDSHQMYACAVRDSWSNAQMSGNNHSPLPVPMAVSWSVMPQVCVSMATARQGPAVFLCHILLWVCPMAI